MNFFEKIKQIFFKNKTKYLSSTIDTEKIINTIKKENDTDKKLDILKNNCQNLSSAEITEIITKLPINKRVEGIEIAQKYITPYDLYDISVKKLDYNGKLQILEKFQNKLDLEDIFELFSNLPPDQRTNALKKCIDRFDSFGISEIIKKYIPLYEKLDCLNLYKEKLNSSSKAAIISVLDTERKITALRQYENELNKTDLNDILCETETNKTTEIFNIIYNNLLPSQIENIIQNYIPEKEKLNALYTSCNKLNSATITDIIKYYIPENQKEEALITLQNRIKSNNIGEIIQLCIKNKNIINKLKNNIYPEDIEYFNNNK